ncbi:hypothetical protein [Deinococcus pimensis]|uniref:hypothetical protein n=1 Tax=Deinococcus pimensis TaxID=309888 RepID=UPI0004B92C92|nr:hypothetical protein [Deinococcus pimensis]
MLTRTMIALGLSFSLAACGAATTTPDQPAGTPGGSVLPSVMLGSWLYGTLSSVDYYDPASDRWMDSSGASEIVTFSGNGRYERTRLLSLTTYGCTSKLFIHEKGSVTIEGDRLTYRPSEGVNKGYTCSPSNSWNTTQINPETWVFRFETTSNGQDQMVLQNVKGDAEAHYGRYQR